MKVLISASFPNSFLGKRLTQGPGLAVARETFPTSIQQKSPVSQASRCPRTGTASAGGMAADVGPAINPISEPGAAIAWGCPGEG